jgi:hypothetical protein
MTDRPTIEQVRAEPAGRQMDAWVAEFVLGLRILDLDHMALKRVQDPRSEVYEEWVYIPESSTDIAAAWEVVEKLNNMQMPNHVGPTRVHRLSNCDNNWHVIFCSDFGYPPGDEVVEKTAPLAICRAALLAVLEEQS